MEILHYNCRRRRQSQSSTWIVGMMILLAVAWIGDRDESMLSSSSSTWLALALQTPKITTIKVCQNKYCCKRASKNVDVLQTMNNMFYTNNNSKIHVEGSSCLSHCDMGPNIELVFPNETSRLMHGMTDTQMCATQLQLLVDDDDDDDEIKSALSPPKILLAASKVMEQSQSMPSIEERIRYLTSVIAKLEDSSSSWTLTAANAHAHALRAQAYLEQQHGNSSEHQLDQAIRDAQRVVRDLLDVATPTTLTVAFRTWVDAEHEKGLQSRDHRRAVAVLQEWYRVQPSYRTKLQREIQELMEKA